MTRGCTLPQYAAYKRLPLDFLPGLGLDEIYYMGTPAVRIPHRGPDGLVLAVQNRLALEKPPAGGDDRFRWKSGHKPMLYGLDRLEHAREAGYVVIVEGASDCHTLWYHGIPAIGVPGASNWKEDRDAGFLDDIPVVYVVQEPDHGGEALLTDLASSRVRDRLRIVSLGEFKDPSGLHVADPDRFLERWRSATDGAVAWTALEAAEAERSRQEAWAACEGLARRPRILDRLVERLPEAGVVGEVRAAKLLYLVMTSRLLDRPASAAVKGPSSAGKSNLISGVLSFFPKSAYYALSAMSERALAYSEEPLKHRVFVIYEAAGLTGDFASYLVRSLLSEGCVRYETVEKTKDGLRPRLIEREGPTSLLVTTTEVQLHPENETRLLSIHVTDTPEQTARVMRALAAESRPVPDLEEWHALQTYLASGPRQVTLTWAPALAELIPPVAIRLRRDFRMLLTLSRTHALLHQESRPRDDEGRIVATFEDYTTVSTLITDLLADGIEASVSPTTRETVTAAQGLITSSSPEVTVVALARALRVDKATALRRARVAIERGYLKNMEDRRGRPARLVMGEPLPDDVTILPSAEVLAQRMAADGSATSAILADLNGQRPVAAGSPDADHQDRRDGVVDLPETRNDATAMHPTPDDDGDDDGGGGGCAVAPMAEGGDTSPSPRADTSREPAVAPPTVDVAMSAPSAYRLITSRAELEEVLPDLLAARLVGLDTETTGLDSRRDRLRLVQLATPERTYILDCFQVNPRVLMPVFENVRRFVGHNLKFDLGFVSAAGLPIPDGDRLFDTMLAAQLLGAGTDDGQPKHSGLAAVAERELRTVLDKSKQTSDWSGALSDAQLAYAARDAAVLPILAERLGGKLTVAELDRVAQIEMRALPAVMWLEQSGARFDVERSSRVTDSARARACDLAEEIQGLIGRPINLNSHQQVKAALGELGLEVDSTSEAALLALVDRQPMIAKLLAHRGATKLAGVFGPKFLEHVNPDTGRVHGDYWQIGAASGRMACSKPNLQNVPRDPAYRACFRAGPGRVLVKADYSQIELRMVAELASEPRMLEAYRRGEDIHAVTAAEVLGRSGQSVSRQDRQAAKALNFGLIFGMGVSKLRGYALSNYGVDLSDEEAVEFRRRFFETYAGLRAWHRRQPDVVIDTRTVAGRRRVAVEHFAEKLNTPAQGTAADGLKSALGPLWETRDRFSDAIPALCVHDELVVECDRDQAEEVAAWVVQCMKDGMQPFLPRVPVEVEAKVSEDWSGE